SLPRAEWGAPAISVLHSGGVWTIAGSKRTAVLDEKTLALTVRTGSNVWAMAAPGPKDMLVKAGAEEFPVGLADAREIAIKPYDTGFKSGVKLKLSRWRHKEADLDLTVFLTIAFEGREEELVFEAAADEGTAVLRQLDWPTAMDTRAVDYTVLSNGRGNKLPRPLLNTV